MTDFRNPIDTFIHRDISWLNFNDRVLEESNDKKNPLLERLRFMGIFASNLDEFYMVRIAGIKRLIDSSLNKKDVFGYLPQEILSQVNLKIEASTKKLYDIYRTKLLKDLEKNNIFIKNYNELTEEQKKFAKKYFEKILFPIITPMAVDQGRPFPNLPSKTMAFALALLKGEDTRLAIIPIPKNISRILKVPSEQGKSVFILIEHIIREHLFIFFKGWEIVDNMLFRIMRDSEITIDESFAPDLMQVIESEVKKRPKAKVISLEVEKESDPRFLETLCAQVDFPHEEVKIINSVLDLTYLFGLISQVGDPRMMFPNFTPAKISYENIFDYMAENDFITHVPFQSFDPIIDLLKSAAEDINVLAIKMTLYRTSEDSEIIKALKVAAKNKKQVTVLVEIKARFDEQSNINWAKELEESGCHVIYGIAGMKIHSKITLIVRKEENNIRRYVHLSTGNYNEKTARIYTDIGYFTFNEDFGRDISDVFNVITGYSLPSRWKRIISAPYDLRKYFFELIDQEIEFEKKYKNGAIYAKMNSLEDPEIIDKLYEASSQNVKIKLVVRGICCLIPGVPGLSENIEVKSVVGRFLEHTRLFVFNNNLNQRVFLSSADWMRRNFDRRIELLFEIYKEDLKDHLLKIMDLYLKDDTKTWILGKDKNYTKLKSGKNGFNAQEHLTSYYNVQR